MAYVKMTLSPGSGRPEIDEILRCPSFDQKYIQNARNEYYELLRTEVILAEEDQHMYKSIYQNNKSICRESYTNFGDELTKKYPESCLAFLICQSYRKEGRKSQQIAMVDYNTLKEASLAYYAEMTRKSSQTGFSQAQHAQPSSSSHSIQHSRSVNLPYVSHQAMTTTGQPAVGLDQPMEYKGQTYYPESMIKELIQHKTTQEKDIYRLQRELKEKKKEVDELRSSRSVNLPYGSHQAMTTTDQPAVGVDQPMEYKGQTYYPESMFKELIQHKTTQEEDIYRLQRELKEKKKEVDELRSRFSSFASKQPTEGNPDFTDLSDINRPVKMAERFHKIYEDEWTTSLESLTRAKKGSICLAEEDAISLLMDIIKISYAFCTNYAEKQTKDMVTLWRQAVDNPFASPYSIDAALSSGASPTPPKVLVDEFKQYRKSFHKECIKNAIKNFKENVITKTPKFERKMLPAVDAYVDVCVEVLWLMSIQVSPMALEWPEPNSPFDSEKYKEYCNKGKIVKLAVWPAVFLNDKGPLMNKGYAMPL